MKDIAIILITFAIILLAGFFVASRDSGETRSICSNYYDTPEYERCVDAFEGTSRESDSNGLVPMGI